MQDKTETMRRQMVKVINATQGSREYLEVIYGDVWDTTQLQDDFSVTGFAAPMVVVKRKSDGKIGSLMFQHEPRFYFKFKED